MKEVLYVVVVLIAMGIGSAIWVAIQKAIGTALSRGVVNFLRDYEASLDQAKAMLTSSAKPAPRGLLRALRRLFYLDVPMLEFMQDYQSPVLFHLSDDAGEYALCKANLPEIKRCNTQSVDELRAMCPPEAAGQIAALATVVHDFNEALDRYLHFRETHTKRREDGTQRWDVNELKVLMRAHWEPEESIKTALKGLVRCVCAA